MLKSLSIREAAAYPQFSHSLIVIIAYLGALYSKLDCQEYYFRYLGKGITFLLKRNGGSKGNFNNALEGFAF